MYLHITRGTLDYLESLKEKNPQTSISARGTEAILYYEDDKEESIFSTNMTYEVIKDQGALDEASPLSVFYIPSAGDGQYSLKSHLIDLTESMATVNGMRSYRVGADMRDENYIVLIKWADMSVYNDFKYTDVYKKYLTSGALKRFRSAESLLDNNLSSKIYYNLEDNVYEDEDEEELND